MNLNPRIAYAVLLLIFILLTIFLQKKYCFLCDSSKASDKPYSYSRTQLVWWSFIIIASFTAVVIATGQLPVLDQSTLILLGIGAATTTVSKIVDVSDEKKSCCNKRGCYRYTCIAE